MEIHNTVQQALIKTIPKKKKCKKAKWLTELFSNSWEKKRGERQRRKRKIYPSECRVPKRARRDKKAFSSEQCKEIEEDNRRDPLKKIRDTKGTFHAKTGTIKDRNSMDLTKAEDNKERWWKYTDELYWVSPVAQLVKNPPTMQET